MSETAPRPAEHGAEGDELEALRARVAELELALHEQAARSNATLAAAQERLYWLDRWNLDLNRLMERPAARGLWEAVRMVVRGARALRGRSPS